MNSLGKKCHWCAQTKFQFRPRNRKTHIFTLPDALEIHKAIMWILKGGDDKKKEVANFIVLPDDVESFEVLVGRPLT